MKNTSPPQNPRWDRPACGRRQYWRKGERKWRRGEDSGNELQSRFIELQIPSKLRVLHSPRLVRNANTTLAIVAACRHDASTASPVFVNIIGCIARHGIIIVVYIGHDRDDGMSWKQTRAARIQFTVATPKQIKFRLVDRADEIQTCRKDGPLTIVVVAGRRVIIVNQIGVRALQAVIHNRHHHSAAKWTI